MKNLLKFLLVTFFVSFFPMITFAANTECTTLNGIGKIICQISQILNSIVPALLALGVVYFVWGVVQYVIAGGDEAKKKGRDQIIYGLIGLTVIVAMWGFVGIITSTFGLTGASAPSLVSLTGTGATCSLAGSPKFQDLLCYFTRIINDSVIPLIFSLALVMFVWGVVQYVINSSEEAKKEKGRQFMIWGIIALAVMISVWGLVGILSSTFNINGSIIPQVHPPGATSPPSSPPSTPPPHVYSGSVQCSSESDSKCTDIGLNCNIETFICE